MKVFLFSTLILLGKFVNAQEDTLIRHALSDKSNFEVMSWLTDKHQMPQKFYVFDTTLSWNINRFYLQDFGTGLNRKPNDEHLPYHHSYLFRDSVLDVQFPLAEKENLFKRAASVKQQKINVRTSIAQTVPSYRSLKSGFILWVSSPVYSTDSAYAFIDFTILEKGNPHKKLAEAHHSTVCVIYKKENDTWSKFKVINRIIL